MRGIDFILSNIGGARNLCELLKTSLGPKGLRKMIYDKFGAIVITNDGSRILRDLETEFQNPIARIFVEIARAQDIEVGDGTKSAVILAGELLINAVDIMTKGIHPVKILEGYKIAALKAIEGYEKISISLPINNETFKEVVLTALSSKMERGLCEKFSELVISLAINLLQDDFSSSRLDMENIKLARAVTGSVDESELINGVVIEKGIAHVLMPKVIKDAKVAVLSCALKIPRRKVVHYGIQVDNPVKTQEIINERMRILESIVEELDSKEVDFVICGKEIDDHVLTLLAKRDIAAIERLEPSDLVKAAKAVKANIVSRVDELSSKDLGFASYIHEEQFGENKMTFIEVNDKSDIITLLLKGSSQRVIEETEVAFRDALFAIRNILADNRVVTGGGSSEIEVSAYLRKESFKYKGIEQILLQKFAEALESIPMSLAKNSGLDPIETLAKLRFVHEKGLTHYGVDCFNSNIGNMFELKIFEPLKVKKQMILSALEMIALVLRSDEAIFRKRGKVL